MGPLILAALLVTGAAIWVALDVAGRRPAAAGASSAALVALAAARAALVAAVILALLHPAVQPVWTAALWPARGHPAEAGPTTVDAMLVCSGGADGSLRLAARSTGCREDERESPAGGIGMAGGAGDLGSTATRLPTLEYRAGTAVIPAGQSYASVEFSQPMSTADYRVVVSVVDSGRPFASDGACRLVMVAGKGTSGFSIMFRRCWFEGEDVPTDPAKNDLTLEWIAIEPR